MKASADDQAISLLILAVFFVMVFHRRGWRPSGTAFGTATWMSEKLLRAGGMLAGNGLVLGRTLQGELIRLPQVLSRTPLRWHRLRQRGEHHHPEFTHL